MGFKKPLAFIQTHRRIIMTFLICAYALYLRILKLTHHNLWVDEYWQLESMKGTFIEFLEILPKREFCSYLSGDYYLIYPFFKIFSYNKWGLAIPHIIATILGFIFLYFVCKQYFKTSLGYIITFAIVCFNATLIEHATEIRTYAVLPTLALMALYYSHQIADQNLSMSIKTKSAIGSFFVLVIWFHAYGILIFSMPFAFAVMNKLINKRKDEPSAVILKDMIKFVSSVLCLAAPLWLYSVFGPHLNILDIDGKSAVGGNIFQFIPNPLEHTAGFLKAILGNLTGYKRLYFLLGGAIIALLIPYKERHKQALFVLTTVFVPIALILFMDIRSDYWFVQRQFCWVMPFFALFIGWIWDSIFHFTLCHFKKTDI